DVAIENGSEPLDGAVDPAHEERDHPEHANEREEQGAQDGGAASSQSANDDDGTRLLDEADMVEEEAVRQRWKAFGEEVPEEIAQSPACESPPDEEVELEDAAEREVDVVEDPDRID